MESDNLPTNLPTTTTELAPATVNAASELVHPPTLPTSAKSSSSPSAPLSSVSSAPSTPHSTSRWTVHVRVPANKDNYVVDIANRDIDPSETGGVVDTNNDIYRALVALDPMRERRVGTVTRFTQQDLVD